MKKALSLLMALFMILSLASCGASPDSASASIQDSSEAVSIETEEKKDIQWDTPYEEPIVLDVVVNQAPPTHADLTDPMESSFFTLAKKELNIDLNIVWALPPDQYDQRFNLMLTSGEIPDVFSTASYSIYSDLAESGAIIEIGDRYNEYLHPELRAFYEEKDVADFKSTVENVNGVSYSFANVFDSKFSTPYWYIRKDYLDKLNLPVPTTIEELLDAAVAMGNAGLGTMSIIGGADGAGFLPDIWGSMIPLFNSYGATPSDGMFIEKDGALDYALIQPEVKDGLAALQDLYARGGLDPDFATKTSANFTEGVLSGKIGIFAGVWWHAAWPLTTMISEESDCEWISVPVLPSEKVASPKTTSKPFTSSCYNMVSADCEHPEALAKLLSLDYELQVHGVNRWGKELAVDKYENTWRPVMATPTMLDDKGHNLEHAAAYAIANAESAEEAKKILNDPVNSGSANLTIGLEGVYDYVWNKNKPSWGWYWSRARKDGGLGLCEELYQNNSIISNSYLGAPLQSEIESGTTLYTLRNEAFLKIILGEESVDSFDTFVEQWKENGGNKMIAEANEWYEAQ